MAPPALRADPLTHAEFVALETASEERHALYEGVMYAMAGGHPRAAPLGPASRFSLTTD